MSTSRHGINLGPGPAPVTDAQWQQRLTQVLDQLANVGQHIAISVTGAAPGHLESVRIDLTGVQLQGPDDVARDSLTTSPAGAAEPVRIGDLTIAAHPLYALGAPAEVDLRLRNVEVGLVTDDAGELWVVQDEVADANDTSGNGRVSVLREDAVRLATEVATTHLAELGLTLRSVDAQLRTPTSRQLEIEVRASVRKGILSAPVQLIAEASVDGQMVARVGHVEASSPNPLVRALLGAARGKIERISGRQLDLNGQLPPWFRLIDLQLEAGENLVAQARFG